MPKVSPDELAKRGRFEYVRVLFPLEGRPVDQVTQEVNAFLGPGAQATPLPTTGQLMVVDTAGRVDAIRKLIASIPLPKKKQPKPQPKPKPKPPAPVFQVHSAKGLNIGAAVETLEKLYGDAKFTGDPRVEQITAFTPPARQEAIAKTLEQMQANISGDNEPRLEIYSVVDQDFDELMTVLAQANPGVQISVDSAAKRLLVVGTAKQQTDVAKTLKKLEAVEVGDAVEGVAVFDVDPAIAGKVVELLQPLIPRSNLVQTGNRIAVRGSSVDQGIAKAAIDQLELAESSAEKPTLRFLALTRQIEDSFLDSIRELEPKAKVSRVPDRNQLAIVSVQSIYDRLAEAVRTTEADLAEPELPQLQKLDVTVEDVKKLLSVMQAAFPKTKMMLNQQENQLLAWTTEETDSQVRERFAELQALLPSKRQEVWKSYSTETLASTEIQSVLESVTDQAETKSDARRERVMVLATEEEHVEIQQALDAFSSGVAEAEFEDVLLAYPINRGDPAALTAMLAGMYPKAKFSPDERTNKVLVTAPLADQRRIQAVLEQLDTPAGDTGELARTYDVKSLPASTVVQLLSSSYPSLRMTAQAKQKQIAVIGPPSAHERFKKTLGELDREGTGSRVESYEVGDASPTTVRSILLQLVPTATVSANSRSQKVVVWADDQDHEKIKQAIEQFTKDPSVQRTTKVYRLQYADADSAEYILRDLMPNARFIEDDRTGTITATASEEEHVEIAAVLQQMDVLGNDRRITEIYRFDRTNARSAERTFERLAPRARVSSIYGTNAIVVSATAAEHELLRDVADKLSGGDSQSVTKVYPLDKKKINVDDVLESIDDALKSRVSIRMNEQTNSLIVRGSDDDTKQVKQLVDELIAQVPNRPQPTAKVYRLEFSNPETVSRVMEDLLPEARFRADSQTGTLTVTALPEEHAEISNVLKQLDIPSQERQKKTEIYRFDRTNARSAEIAFERLIPRARVSSLSGTNSIVVTATAAEHEIFREAADKLNGEGRASVTKVYPLDEEQIDAEDVLDSIDDSLRARVSIRVNEAMNSLIVRGAEEDQVKIQQLIDEIVAQVPPLKKQVAQVYQFENSRGDSSLSAFRSLFPKATFSYDYRNRALLATAPEDDQERIAELAKQLDRPRETNKTTKVYRLKSLPASRMDNIAEDLVPNGEVTYDSQTNVLVVSGSETDHERVQQAVDAMNQASEGPTEERVYTLKSANPVTIQNALERLMPQTNIASDMESRSLIVSAEEEDQQRVQQLIQKLDAAPGQEAVMRAYVVKFADGKQTFESLRNTFNGNGNFSISFQEASKTIFVVATPKNHDIFEELLNQLDTPVLATADRVAKTYGLSNMSAKAARTTITALLQGTSPTANVEVDELQNQLVLVGTEVQHAKVAETLGQLSGSEFEFEVFNLAYTDPWTIESAIDTLFASQPISARPSVTSDYFSQRLFVRGTNKHIDQVKKLLSKMGERIATTAQDSGQGDIRTIPFRGDVEAAVRQVEKLWPQLRKNRIEVVAPSDPSWKIEPTRGRPNDASNNGSLEERLDNDNSVLHGRAATSLKYISLQDSTRSAAPTAASTSSPVAKDAADPSQFQAGEEPVVIIPQGEQITIASSDTEALDQLEELLTVMSRVDSNSAGGMGSDFAVILLRNTGASSTRDLLANLFKQLREAGGSVSNSRGFGGPQMSSSQLGYGNLFGPNFGNVAVVADDRLNALIIHGDRKERELIKELLTILDSEDLPNPIVVYQPELVLLRNTQAQRVLAILKNVYRSQLTTGGGRKKLEIPEGVSTAVASMLQQINAASASPVLTLDVDETTNSIIMRAPPELRKEIKVFVESLDQSAGENRSRNVRVVRLKNSKSDRITDALQQFLLKSNSRNR